MFEVTVADIRAVDDEDDSVAAGVVALPQLAQAELAAHVPDLDVHVRQRQRRHVLAHRRHRLQLRVRVLGQEERLRLLVERRLARVVQPEQDHGVLLFPPREQVERFG